MTTLLYSHPACLEHDPGQYHPERPARLSAIEQSLQNSELAGVHHREAPPAEKTEIATMHPIHYVEFVLGAIPDQGNQALDGGDTVVSPGSAEAALRAAGAICAAVDAVGAGEAKNAFCAVRPPGHHAEPQQAMGFCLFNNVAIGAARAHLSQGRDRVAVVDFDVHHGNGTQAMFWDQPKMFFASSHQMPLYPGTGSANERGASGNIVNVPLHPMAGSDEFRAAWSGRILPALAAFDPDFILISAGFDAHLADPMAQLRLTEDDFFWVTSEICRLAEDCCEGRVVSTLEGGYDLAALGASAVAHVKALVAAAK